MPKTPGTDLYQSKASKARYEAYSRLQATALAFNETLPIPEIVAIGGQSDGKSSLIEALLGFRFNITSSEMGTRRPLVVCMVHDATAKEPRCRLQDEDDDSYSSIIPENSISDAIRERTETHLRRIGATVSSKSIVMRAEYAYCPNITLIDTPGFILKARAGEAESTPDDIMNMVKEQCAPKNRLILFLQQSSVEWCSSLWMHVVQSVDPTFERTIMVASKFDNRLKELTERWEVDKYLSASGYLPPNVKPFYVSLPKERMSGTSGQDWRKAIQHVDSTLITQLRDSINGGFDEERFGARIGFGNLKRFLEDELAARYRDAAPATLALLQDRCAAAAAELTTAEERLQKAGDVGALRSNAIEYVLSISSLVDGVLYGLPSTDPSRYGLTTEQERELAGVGAWPGVAHDKDVCPPNAGLRLFGGAAIERCLKEFRLAAQAASFPTVPKDRVANMLLAYKSRGQSAGAAAKAAEELARGAAKESLGPLLDIACARLCFLVTRAFDVAAEQQQLKRDAVSDTLRGYVAFHAAVRTAFQSFAHQLEKKAKDLMSHHLEAATGQYAVAAMQDQYFDTNHSQDADWEDDDDAENVDEIQVDRTLRVIRPDAERPAFIPTQMTVPETPSPDVLAAKKDGRHQELALHRQVHMMAAGRNIDATSPARGRMTKVAKTSGTSVVGGGGGYVEVCTRAQNLFDKIRQGVTKSQSTTLKAAFLEPLHSRLSTEMSVKLLGCADGDFMTMFSHQTTLESMQAERDGMARRVEGLNRMKEEFGEIARVL